MTLEVITLIKKIAELTKDDPTAVTYTNGHEFWIIVNNYPCTVASTNEAVYIPGLNKEDLIF